MLGMSENFQLFIQAVKGELHVFEMLLRIMGVESFSETWTKNVQKNLF